VQVSIEREEAERIFRILQATRHTQLSDLWGYGITNRTIKTVALDRTKNYL
jgi:hypothetical protein